MALALHTGALSTQLVEVPPGVMLCSGDKHGRRVVSVNRDGWLPHSNVPMAYSYLREYQAPEIRGKEFCKEAQKEMRS